MKRPLLVSSVAMLFACGFLLTFHKYAPLILLGASAVVFILYFIKPLHLKDYIKIPTVCVAVFLVTLSFIFFTGKNVKPLLKFDGTENFLSGKVVTTPYCKENSLIFTIKADKIGNQKVNTNIIIELPKEKGEDIELYDYLSFENAELKIPKNQGQNGFNFSKASDKVILEGEADSYNFLWSCDKTPYYYLLSFREKVNNIIDSHLNSPTAGLLKGMLFGEKSDLDFETYSYFRNSGIAHILAVSGLHTSMWCGLILAFLGIFKIPKKISHGVCIVFLGAFCVLSGFSPSVLRASLMMFVYLLAIYFDRRSDPLNSLGFAVTVLLLFNPYIILSLSFQLSAFATLGVLLAIDSEQELLQKTDKIRGKLLKKFCDYILTSILVSGFIGIFTMPLSAYYFGVFTVLAPLSNILCVGLSFYCMILGVIAIALCLVGSIFESVGIFLFRVTDFLLDFVIEITKGISSIKLCTIPVHKRFLLIGTGLALLIIAIGYIVYKNKKKKPVILRVTALASAISLLAIISIPLFVPNYKDTVTVVEDRNNLNVIVRSGFNYALISSSPGKFNRHSLDYLPIATSESLRLYSINYINNSPGNEVEIINKRFSPETTIIPKEAYSFAVKGKVDLPRNTIISNSENFQLSKEISIQIVDTYRLRYAIIRGGNKNIFIHLKGDTNIKNYIDTESFQVFVFSKAPRAQEIPQGTIIINSDSKDFFENKDILKTHKDIYFTAKNGDFKVNI